MLSGFRPVSRAALRRLASLVTLTSISRPDRHHHPNWLFEVSTAGSTQGQREAPHSLDTCASSRSPARCRTQNAHRGQDTLTRARAATSILFPSQGSDTASGRRTSRSRCHPASWDVQVPQSQLGAFPAWRPAAWQRQGLPSASCCARGTASSSTTLSAPPLSQQPSAGLGEVCCPPAFHRLGSIWDALPLNCQSRYCDQVNVANLCIYCLGK